MILCISDIIIELLEYYYKGQNILFCIDDMTWLDSASLETLETLASKFQINNCYSTSIAFFVTTRDRLSLEKDEKKKYDKIEVDFFNEWFTTQYSIMLKNFNQHIIKQVLLIKERFDLCKYVESIYKITKGNPQELTQTLKFEDNEIIQRINDKTSENKTFKLSGNYFTRTLIETLTIENEYTIIILSLASIIEKNLKPQILLSLCLLYSKQVTGLTYNYEKHENAIELLKRKNLIIEEEDIFIKHDSIKVLIIEYLTESGDLNIISRIIVDFFINDDMSKDEHYLSRIKIALNLMRTINPYQSFQLFIKLINEDKNHYSIDNIEVVATSLFKCIDKISVEEINNIVVPYILQTLVITAKYQLANSICELLNSKYNKLSKDNKTIYLTSYVKVLIDLGFIKTNESNKLCAIEAVDILVSQSKNDNELLLAYLLKMSAHEHVLEFQEIRNTYEKAQMIIENSSNLSNESLSTFYRNKGLVKFHADLKDDYLKACQFAQNIDDYIKRNIMLGTCHNNLGLSYFYNGCITEALKHFKIAYDYLKIAGYDLLRVINNISACYFILGDYNSSYKYISIAKSIPLKGMFESICVDINMALNMYKCGQADEAKHRLDNIINDYNNGLIKTDTAAYSAAMVNRGYIFFKESDFLNSYKMFKASRCHKYKNANDMEQRKRDNLCKLSLYNEAVISDIPEKYVDLTETTNILFKCPYSLILLAFYVI